MLIEPELKNEITKFSFIQNVAKTNECDEICIDHDNHVDFGLILNIRSSHIAHKTDAFH